MRSDRARTAVLGLLVVLCVACVSSFNLDTKIPIVKRGPETSHFGYSVAQHKTLIPGAPKTVLNKYVSWMLVGAPKGVNLQPGTNRSGALFKCPLTTLTTDCQQVQTDGLKNSNGLYKGNSDGSIMGPTDDEIKDDQWMGVTLKSQGEGGDILVCGHRYQHKGVGELNFRWGYGLCYRLKNNFEYEDNYQPCMGKPVDSGQEQFGYCQAGTSGIILEDEVVLGIPGTYNWRGTIHTRNISDDYLYRDKTEYFGVYTNNKSPVDKYSYLGYSVTAGRFFGNKLSYIAGAPRSRGTGQVIFFSRERLGNNIMEYDLVLNGETFASSYGFEVLAMDVNGDKKDDLVVSAPFYFTKTSSGAVYVYLNDGSGISNETPFTRLEGPAGESRFGYSMTSLGDLNLDGYNDLAIGAPYDKKGAIYIYLGSRNGIIKEPSQVIRAEDLPGLPYDAFGYALSGGMDLDNNNYNDLLTSSFCSDRVILLRARPIIDIQTKVDSTSLQNINPTNPGCAEDPGSRETCFSFDACFKMINEGGAQTFLSLQYNISERFYKDQPTNRIRFHRSLPEKPSTVVKVVKLKPEDTGTYQCSREIVYLKGGQRDLLRPVRFILSYKIYQKDPKPVEEGEQLPDINDYPILNQQEAVRYFEANFAKDCGDDDICESDLSLEGELDLEKHPEEDFHIFDLGKRQFFTLTTNVSNKGEPAYLPNLYISHDKAIDLSVSESNRSSYHCVPVKRGLLHCNLDNPLVNSTGPLRLVFKPSGFSFKHRYIDLIAWVNSTSEELRPRNNRIKFVLEVKRRAEISITGTAEPEQVFYSGDVVGESAIETLDEIGTEVVHNYLVDNRGPWRVDKLLVEIQWPYQVENNKKEGKWLLYLTDIPIVDGGEGECDVNPEYVNPLVLYHKQLDVEDEASWGNERLTGVTPPSVSTTTKVTKVSKSSSKKVITSKKTYTKKESKHSSVSSSNFEEDDYDDYEGSGAYGRGGGTRTYNRVSRKVYTSPKNKIRTDKDSSIDYGTDEYENYDTFFSEKESDRERDRSGGSRNVDGHSRYDVTHTRRVYTDSDTSGSDLVTDSQRLNAVDDIRSVRDGDETYLKGYDRNGVLVWSSRSRGGGTGRDGGSVHSRTEVTRKVYSSSRDGESGVGGAGGARTEQDFWHEEQDNERLLTNSMGNIADFRIVREGDESYVNGYDHDKRLIWTSRVGHLVHGWSEGARGGGVGEGSHSSSSSVRKEYNLKQSSRDEDGDGVPETRREWSSSITDQDGTRRRNGSSVGGDGYVDRGRDGDRRFDLDRDRNVDLDRDRDRSSSSYGREGYERRTSYSSSGGGSRSSSKNDFDSRVYGGGESASGRKDFSYRGREEDSSGGRKAWDTGSSSYDSDGYERRTYGGASHHQDYNSRNQPQEGSGYSSVRKEYSYNERTRDEDGDGVGETRRSWSSSVADNNGSRSHSGSSLTDEHGTRLTSGSYRPDDSGTVHSTQYERRYYSPEDRRGGDRHRIEYSGGGHQGGERHHSRIESSGSGHQDGESHRIEYSGGGHQGGERHRVESSGSGHQVRERHRIESSSGSGHQDGERYHSRIESSGREGVRHGSDGGETRYRFDWNLPGDRQYDRHSEGDRVRSESSGGDRWSTSGGFRRRYYDSDGNPREGDTRYDDRAFEDGNSYHTSRQSRRYESSRDLQQPQNDESSIHGDTYSRAVVDRNSGNVQVYSQKVFSRRSGDHWQEVHGPFKDEEWSQDFHYDDEPLKRTKREREFVIKPEAITDAQTGKTMQIVNFRCDGDVPTAKCFTFQCTIRNLDADQSATIRIPSRLWNSTLVEDYPRVSFVSIKSKGELILPEAIRVDQDQSDDVSYAETLAYSNLLEQLPAEEVPLWVILVSILAGLLLLVLIAIILWKLGFFKRRRPDPTLSGNIDRDANGYN